MKNAVKNFPWEALVWTGGLITLAMLSPSSGQHFTICVIGLFGFDFCPGCGLGRSLSLLFHGLVQQSMQTHPLGIFAVAILSVRIVRLFRLYYIDLYGKHS